MFGVDIRLGNATANLHELLGGNVRCNMRKPNQQHLMDASRAKQAEQQLPQQFGSVIFLLCFAGKHKPRLSYQLYILRETYSSQSQPRPLLSVRHPNTWVLFAGLRRIGPTHRSTGQREKKKEAREPLASTKIPTDAGERQVRVAGCTAEMYSLLLLACCVSLFGVLFF
ncbi:hypothetical protein HDV63DRAFT_223226 [Trichoderma sp. SZMC 28014]